ncbi:MAG: ribosome assembly factor SBDS [Candidatus Aenigmarchaeota archaeon]|nr:ribosome assembly factor SBDS [Candidatus Aenigmarchaeota archaeon]
MVSLDNAVIARITKGKEVFEIFVDSEKALEFKRGKPYSIENILAVQEVFRDAKKGERVSSSDLEKGFSTTDILKIAETIVKDGEVQITTEERRKMVEQKKKEIADIISKQGIDPKTKLPHPPQRIMNAMEQSRINIDPFKEARDQVEAILKVIQEIIPISIERIELAVKVPVQYAGRISSAIRTLAPVKKEEWKSDAWYALIEIPAGMQSHILDKLNDLTNGNVETSVVERKQF